MPSAGALTEPEPRRDLAGGEETRHHFSEFRNHDWPIFIYRPV